jgi:hypothetical protein
MSSTPTVILQGSSAAIRLRTWAHQSAKQLKGNQSHAAWNSGPHGNRELNRPIAEGQGDDRFGFCRKVLIYFHFPSSFHFQSLIRNQ